MLNKFLFHHSKVHCSIAQFSNWQFPILLTHKVFLQCETRIESTIFEMIPNGLLTYFKLSSSLMLFTLIARFLLTDLMIFRSSRSVLFLLLPLPLAMQIVAFLSYFCRNLSIVVWHLDSFLHIQRFDFPHSLYATMLPLLKSEICYILII